MKEFKYTIDGKEYKVEIVNVDEQTNVADIKVNGESFSVTMDKPAEEEKKPVKTVVSAPAEEADAQQPTDAKGDAVKAPLPGTITAINVKVGDEVKSGDTLLVLEAMKMANNIEAEKDGKVTAVCVKVGQSVMEDDNLVIIG